MAQREGADVLTSRGNATSGPSKPGDKFQTSVYFQHLINLPEERYRPPMYHISLLGQPADTFQQYYSRLTYFVLLT